MTEGPTGESRLRFSEAVRKSLFVWRAHPWLPVVTVALFLPSTVLVAMLRSDFARCAARATSCGDTQGLGGLTSLVQFLEFIFFIGFVGAQRVWYLRAFRGKSTDARTVWRVSWGMWSRFFVLGGVIWIPSVIVGMILSTTVHHSLLVPLTIVTIVYVLLDFALTFATPALALTEPGVGDALKRGFALMRREWPRTAPYVLIPGLLPFLLGGVSYARLIGTDTSAIFGVLGNLFNLLMKGATVAFYIEHEPVAGDDGAPRAREVREMRMRSLDESAQRRREAWGKPVDP